MKENRGKRWLHADWQTEPPNMLYSEHGGSRVKLSFSPFCGTESHIPGPTRTKTI